ncbi:MAG TPA: c-type cytochrome [Xanthomonadaceae bacterium]|nr:c-type cytochrome [Xanthomonadaceae bacterium]
MTARLPILLLLCVTLVACGTDRGDPAGPAPTADVDAPATDVVAIADEPQALPQPPASLDLCVSCHGDSAPSPFTDMPTVQGLPADAIENALFDFRARVRPCRKSHCSADGTCPDLDMCAVAEDLDEADIAVLARWFAKLPFVPADQHYSTELHAQGRWLHETRCESCHAEGGVAPIDQANRLRGQHKEYLRLALDHYRSGQRMAVGMMDASVKALTEEEIEALLEFYASPLDDS